MFDLDGVVFDTSTQYFWVANARNTIRKSLVLSIR